MRSWMVENLPYLKAEAQHYSDLCVMRSGAGYFVGTWYTDPKDGFTQPGTRDSMEYYATHEEAQHALDTQTFTVRKHP